MAPANQIVKDFAIARISITVGAHAIVQRLRQGQTLLLYRDPKDTYDPEHAIMVVVPAPGSKRKVGYLPSGLAKELAPLMDAGLNVIARKAQNPLYGVCQVAYIPPVVDIVPVEQKPMTAPFSVPIKELETPKGVDLSGPVTEAAPASKGKTETLMEQFAKERPLPEGVTQQDSDEAFREGRSARRYIKPKDESDDKPTSDTAD